MKTRSPEQSAGLLSRLYFRWVGPTLREGMRRPLAVETLLPLNAAEDPTGCDAAFAAELAAQQGRDRPVLRAVWRVHRGTLRAVFIISMVHCASSIASPLALRRLIGALSGDAASTEALLLALALFLCALVFSMTAHHMYHILLKLMVRVRIGLVAAIYRKALKLTVASRQEAPAGQIINLMGTDAQKLVNSLNIIHSLWMHPLQLALVLGVLYWILGPPALAGCAVLLLFLLASAFNARRYVRVRKLLVLHSDDRVGLVNELLMSIRVIKFYAWERSFVREVESIRAREVHELSRLARLSAIGQLIFLSTPVVVAVATFTTYVAAGHVLNAADVFSSLALFTVLRHAMVTLPDVATSCLEANVAVRRLERFLALPELPARAPSSEPPGTVTLAAATVEWTPGVPALRDANLRIAPGELVCVVGSVGAGKSALMMALLGDLAPAKGVVDVGGDVAYVSQQAWIMGDTIRNNVLFGLPFDPERYARVIAASALEYDLRRLPDGDATEIGERGVNLSGGQRQRISLARALYCDAAVVLLDDPMSALDNAVGQAVFESCLLGEMRGRTRILATHRLEFVNAADRVLVMEGGRIVEEGTAEELRARGGKFDALWRAYRHGTQDDVDQPVPVEAAALEPPAQSGRVEEPKANGGGAGAGEGATRLMTDEERNTGVVGWSVYRMYLAFFAPSLVGGLLGLAFVAKELLSVGTDAWLASWSTRGEAFEAGIFLAGYFILGALACASTYVRSLFVSLRGLVAGSRFHESLLGSVLRAPMGFFESTPVGRVLNRFSRDMEAIDQQIPRSLLDAVGCVFTILSTLAVVVFVTPWALVIVLPIAVAYYRVQRVFRPASREGQRLDSITRSPVFAQFSESLAGVQVIRAFGAERRFERQLLAHLETNSRSFYTIVSANRWLGTRIETLGAAIVAAAALTPVVAQTFGKVHPGFVGLSVTYALAITGAMNWAVRMFSQVESNLNSVERIDHYARLPHERWEGADVEAAWPRAGRIEIEALELRYRPDLPPVVRDFSCRIEAGEKVGIVGRTGAGKSSLLLGLFRVVEASAGRILVDGVDVATLGLERLRSALAIIPQEPVLFRGSVRKNLDPFGRFSDAELRSALDRARLGEAVAALRGGLDADVFEGGSNFSVGQRQLLCLARALLKGSRVLLLDEATASVDVATDALIQRTIREEFAGATVITIAHRLSTVMDCDRVLVLDAGRVVEFDAPRALAVRPRGAFAALLKEEHRAAARA